ncbi:MAG: MiaB/RimO family radical SAM methylthiotransferase [Desulfovibrionaceae bacterium]|nr:MiaB/RimO family radical SAM methylthiotransferase [Desulfovibrionaceae bacterium]
MPEAVQFYIVTLGCKVNQYESQALREAWLNLGWQEKDNPDEVCGGGVLLVHSCAVTAPAVADVRATVRRLHKTNPRANIWIIGCAAQTHLDEMKTLPGVQAVIPTARKPELLENPEQWLLNRMQGAEALPPPDGKRDYPPFAISGYRRARPVLKVQDGCSHCCTYCIVPLARGSAVSRETQEVLSEARRLLQAGFREIILSGINLSQYRMPRSIVDAARQGSSEKTSSAPGYPALHGNDFWSLLSLLEQELSDEWQGLARLRISSLEPGQLNERALDVLAQSRLVCPHLHISLQSGSSSVLRRMGRGHYQPDLLPEFCAQLKKIWPRFGMGADLLVGFPGESEAEFEETMRLVEALPLTYAHVFPYSRRPGTPAAELPGQLEKPILTSRSAALRKVVQEKKVRFLEELALNRAELKVTLEDNNSGVGSSEYYTECRFSHLNGAPVLRSLIPARAIAREQGCLLVEPKF